MPTKNRVEYAMPAISCVLKTSSDDVELVVQDNSSNSELEDALSGLNDPRLKYHHTKESVDVIHNFSIALENSTGDYICFIGDDDCVNPEIVDAALWAKSQGYDAVLPSRPAQYWWPDLRFYYYGDSFSGSLELAPFSGNVLFPNPEAEMLKCARRAGQDFFDLPKVYYGIVKRSIMDQVKAKCHTYFPGPSPDMAGAMAAAGFVKSMCKIDYPLFVPGSSAKSTAGSGGMKKHQGRLEDQAHLPKDCIRNWSLIVPKFFSGPTIWGEDTVQALKALGRDDMLKRYNVALLHSMCAVFYPAHLSETIKHLCPALRAARQNCAIGIIKFAFGCVFAWFRRFRSLAFRMVNKSGRGSVQSFTGLPDVETAVDKLMDNLRSRGISLADCLARIDALTTTLSGKK